MLFLFSELKVEFLCYRTIVTRNDIRFGMGNGNRNRNKKRNLDWLGNDRIRDTLCIKNIFENKIKLKCFFALRNWFSVEIFKFSRFHLVFSSFFLCKWGSKYILKHVFYTGTSPLVIWVAFRGDWGQTFPAQNVATFHVPCNYGPNSKYIFVSWSFLFHTISRYCGS